MPPFSLHIHQGKTPGATQHKALLVTASRDYWDAPRASAACRSASRSMSRGSSSSAGDAANLAQEWMALPNSTAKLTWPSPASGSVSKLAAPWLRKRGIDGLCWLQQPEGSITQLSRTRMEKVICGSHTPPSCQRGKQRGSNPLETASSSQALHLPTSLLGDFSSPGQV